MQLHAAAVDDELRLRAMIASIEGCSIETLAECLSTGVNHHDTTWYTAYRRIPPTCMLTPLWMKNERTTLPI